GWSGSGGLRRAGSRRLTCTLAPLPPIDIGTAECAVTRPTRSRAGGRIGRVLGRSHCSAIRVPARQALSQISACRDLAWPSDGARQALGAAQDGNAAPIQGSRLHEEDRGRNLWWKFAQFA